MVSSSPSRARLNKCGGHPYKAHSLSWFKHNRTVLGYHAWNMAELSRGGTSLTINLTRDPYGYEHAVLPEMIIRAIADNLTMHSDLPMQPLWGARP